MKCTNYQILSLRYTFLLRDCKGSKGKETPCELVGQNIYGSTYVLDQLKLTQKMLSKVGNNVFYVQYI